MKLRQSVMAVIALLAPMAFVSTGAVPGEPSVWLRSPTDRVEDATVTASDGFGSAVAVSGTSAIVVAPDQFSNAAQMFDLERLSTEPNVIVPVSADTYVRTDLDVRRNDNYGCQHFVAVGTGRGGGDTTVGDADGMRSLVRFELPELGSRQVVSASLEMSVAGFDNGSESSVYSIDVHRVVDSPGIGGADDRTPWSEGTGFEDSSSVSVPAECVGTDPASGVAWAAADSGNPDPDALNNLSQPDFDPAVIASASVSQRSTASGDVVSWDVTDTVRAWLDGSDPNFGFLLRDLTTDGSFRGVRFGAREALQLGVEDALIPSVEGPRLVIELAAKPVCEFVEVVFEPRLLNRDGSDTSAPVALAPGCEQYSILLHSSDPLHTSGYQPGQTDERWFLEGLDENGVVVYTSPPTGDLPETRTWATFPAGVDDLSQVVGLRARHLREGGGINSIDAGVILIPAPPTQQPDEVKLFAVAYINSDGRAGYSPDDDVLIARMEDTNGDGVPSSGDTVRTDRYPLDVDASATGEFQTKVHEVVFPCPASASFSDLLVVCDTGNSYFQFQAPSADPNRPTIAFENYLEGVFEDGLLIGGFGSSFADNLGDHPGDFIQVLPVSPSDPLVPVARSGSTTPRPSDDPFLNVELFEPVGFGFG